MNAYRPPLTEAEHRVAALLLGDLTCEEIGRHLHVSRNTVKTHVQSIYRKLGVANRRAARLALHAARRGGGSAV